MTWTYTGDPSASNLETVRFLVGDTAERVGFSLSDAEVQWLLSQYSQAVYPAAGGAAEIMAARYSQEATKQKQVGELRLAFDYTATSKTLFELADRLKNSSGNGSLVYTFMARESDGGVPDSQFAIGMMDNVRGTGAPQDQVFSDFSDGD